MQDKGGKVKVGDWKTADGERERKRWREEGKWGKASNYTLHKHWFSSYEEKMKYHLCVIILTTV